MKTLSNLFVVFAMALSYTAAASPEGRLIIRVEQGDAAKTIKVQLANLENNRTNISLIDTEGKHWFFESVAGQNGYATLLKLDGMPDGDYIVLIGQKGRQYVQALTLAESGIGFFREPGSGDSKEVIARLADNKLAVKGKLISHFSEAEGQQVNLQLANLLERPATISLVSPTGGGMMKQKAVTGQKGYNERWNLEGMAYGAYFFCIKSADATVIQFLKLTEEGIELTNGLRMEKPLAEEKAIFSVR